MSLSKTHPQVQQIGVKRILTIEQDNEYIKCSNDIFYWAENYIYIKHQTRGKIKFEFRAFQREILKQWISNDTTIQELYVYALQASRQIGKSTLAMIFIAHILIFERDKQCAIISKNPAAAKNILRMMETLYLELPLWQKPAPIVSNMSYLEFENGCSVFIGPTTENSLVSGAYYAVVMDEFALLNTEKSNNDFDIEFWGNNFPAIDTTGQYCLMISTPREGSLFNKIITDIEAGEYKNEQWFTRTVIYDVIEGRDDNWKKRQIKKLGGGEKGELKFLREYECVLMPAGKTLIKALRVVEMVKELSKITPIETTENGNMKIYERPIRNAKYIGIIDAGQGVGEDSSVFNIIRVTRDFKIKRKFIIDKYKHKNTDLDLSDIISEFLDIFEENINRVLNKVIFHRGFNNFEELYEHLDNSVFVLFQDILQVIYEYNTYKDCYYPNFEITLARFCDVGKYNVSAVYADNTIDIKAFPLVCRDYGYMYNHAYITGENNNEGGSVLKDIRDLGYKNLFIDEDKLEKGKVEVGQRTTTLTKKIMVTDFKREIENKKYGLNINDDRFLQQIKTFVRQNNGTYSGESGLHDDIVMTGCIGCQFINSKEFREQIFITDYQDPEYREAITTDFKMYRESDYPVNDNVNQMDEDEQDEYFNAMFVNEYNQGYRV